MVVITKLRLDIIPPLKPCKTSIQDVQFATFSDIEPKPNFRPVHSLAVQPHLDAWRYERLAVAAGNKIHLWAIRRSLRPLTSSENTTPIASNNLPGVWSDQAESEIKECLRKQFTDAAINWKSFLSASALQKKKRAEQITASIKPASQPVQDFPWAPQRGANKTTEKILAIKEDDNDSSHPTTMLLATLDCHERNFVHTIRWAPSGRFAASQDAQVVCIWFYEGPNVQAIIPQSKLLPRCQSTPTLDPEPFGEGPMTDGDELVLPPALGDVSVGISQGTTVNPPDDSIDPEEPVVMQVEKSVTYGSTNQGVHLELWAHRGTIRSSAGELKDIAFLDDHHIAVASTDKITLYGIERNANRGITTMVVSTLELREAPQGTAILAMASSEQGDALIALCSDHVVRSWRVGNPSDVRTPQMGSSPALRRRGELLQWESLEPMKNVFGDPATDLLLTNPRLSTRWDLFALPLGATSRLGQENFALLGRWGDLLSAARQGISLGDGVDPNTETSVLTRLRGHRTRVNVVSFGPTLYTLRPPDVVGDSWKHPLLSTVLKQARLVASWPLFVLACVTSTDGAVSFWRIFLPNKLSPSDGEDPDANFTAPEGHTPVEAQCFLVFTPRFIDEQATVSDLAWTPDGSACVVGADDGSMTLIGFQGGEIQGDPLRFEIETHLSPEPLSDATTALESASPDEFLLSSTVKGRTIALDPKFRDKILSADAFTSSLPAGVLRPSTRAPGESGGDPGVIILEPKRKKPKTTLIPQPAEDINVPPPPVTATLVTSAAVPPIDFSSIFGPPPDPTSTTSSLPRPRNVFDVDTNRPMIEAQNEVIILDEHKGSQDEVMPTGQREVIDSTNGTEEPMEEKSPNRITFPPL